MVFGWRVKKGIDATWLSAYLLTNGSEFLIVDFCTKQVDYPEYRIDTTVKLIDPLYGRLSPRLYRVMNVAC